jgi:hypothetical protein
MKAKKRDPARHEDSHDLAKKKKKKMVTQQGSHDLTTTL